MTTATQQFVSFRFRIPGFEKITLFAIILLFELAAGACVVILPKAVAIGMVLSIIVFSLTFLNPWLGLFLIIFFLPFRADEFILVEFGSVKVRISEILAIPVSLGWILRSAFGEVRKIPIEKTGLEFPLVLFGWWILLSLAWATSFPAGLSKVIQYTLGMVLLYMSANLIKTDKFLNTLLLCWMLAGTFASVIGVGEFMLAGAPSVIRSGEYTYHEIRSSSILHEPNNLSRYLADCILMGTAWFLALRPSLTRKVLLFAIAVMLAGLLTTFSRGSQLSLCCAILFLAYHSKYLRKMVLVYVLLLLFASLFIESLSSIFIAVLERLISTFTFASPERINDIGIRCRLLSYQIGLQMIINNPLLGIGAGSYSILFKEYLSEILPYAFRYRVQTLSFNLYLMILVDFGLIGFGIFVWMWIKIFKILKNALRALSPYYRNLCLGIISVLIFRFLKGFTGLAFIEDRALWLLVGMGIAIISMGSKKKVSEARAEQVEG